MTLSDREKSLHLPNTTPEPITLKLQHYVADETSYNDRVRTEVIFEVT